MGGAGGTRGCSHTRVCAMHVHAVECVQMCRHARVASVREHAHACVASVCKRARVARVCNCASMGMHVLQGMSMQECTSMCCEHAHVACASVQLCKYMHALKACTNGCKHMQMHACIASLYCKPVLQLHTCASTCVNMFATCVCKHSYAYACKHKHGYECVHVHAAHACAHASGCTRVCARAGAAPVETPTPGRAEAGPPGAPGGRLHRENEN